MQSLYEKEIAKLMVSTVQEGNLEEVKLLTKTYGVSFSNKWLDDCTLLLAALDSMHTYIADYLIEAGSKVNPRNAGKGIPLHFAVRYNLTDSVRTLLRKGAHVNARALDWIALHLAAPTGSECTALHVAARTGNMETTKLLLNYGANTNMTILDGGKTALHIAVESRYGGLADLLLKYGADVNARYKYPKMECGRTALHIAVERGFVEIVQCLLKYRPDMNKIGNRIAVTVAMHKESEMLSSLLEYGFVVIQGDKNNVLFNAIRRGDVNELEGLFKTNGNSKTLLLRADGNRCTPLHVATRYQKREVVKLMISCGANPNAKDENGKSPLAYTIENYDFSIFEILLTSEKNLGQALWKAVRIGAKKYVECLLERGADANARDESGDGLTLLHLAVEKSVPSIINILIDYGADVNSIVYERTEKGYRDSRTPLHYSVLRVNPEVCEILLNRGADVNVKTYRGYTALHLACLSVKKVAVPWLPQAQSTFRVDSFRRAAYLANQKCVELLLEHGSDINMTGRGNKNALDYLRGNGGLLSRCPMFTDWKLRKSAFECLLRHVIKSKIANLYVSDRNQRYLETEHYCNDRGGKIYASECTNEVAILKTEKIDDSSLTFYDILAADCGQWVHISKNETIGAVVLSTDFQKRFPVYGSMIYSKFEVGKRRRDLEDVSSEILLIIHPYLTFDCINIIHSYLTNEDLRLFINGCSKIRPERHSASPA